MIKTHPTHAMLRAFAADELPCRWPSVSLPIVSSAPSVLPVCEPAKRNWLASIWSRPSSQPR